jgi:hypothetical protein
MLSSCVYANPGQLAPGFGESDWKTMRVFFYHAWTGDYHWLAAAPNQTTSNTKLTLTSAAPLRTQFDGYAEETGVHSNSGNRYFVENSKSLLLENSGQFYHELETVERRDERRDAGAEDSGSDAGSLMYYAPTEEERANGFPDRMVPAVEVVAANLTELLVSSSPGLVLSRLVLQHSRVDFRIALECCQSASFLNSSAVRIATGGDGSILGPELKVQHTGGYGVWFGCGVRDGILHESNLTDLGAGGVRVGGNDGACIATNITVTDCELSHGGRIFPQGMGALLQHAIQSTVTHCDVFDFFQTGVSLGW